METDTINQVLPNTRRSSTPDKVSPETYDLMYELTKEAVERYTKTMASFMEEEILPPSSLELRSRHAEAKLNAIDHFRKRFIGRPVGVWKLEREIDAIYQVMAVEALRVRKQSFGSDNSDKSYDSVPEPSTPASSEELESEINSFAEKNFINCQNI